MNKQLLTISLGLTLLGAARLAVAQGSLTPPGAPAPTMRTLDQVYQKAAQAETRVDVLTLPGDGNAKHVINQPGSYFLSSNLVGTVGLNGINITASDVRLDLNGFVLIGVSNRTAIVTTASGVQRIRVENGRLSGWQSGVNLYTAGTGSNVFLADLHIALTGESFGNGIIARDGLQVWRCQIDGGNGASGSGISCNGERGLVQACRLYRTYGGILVGGSSMVRDCQIIDCVGNTGINAGSGSLVTGNLVKGSQGIVIAAAAVACGNVVQNSVSGGGIRATGSNCRIEDNQLVGNTGTGVTTDSGTSNNLVIRNHAVGNSGGNYSFLGTTIYGPLVSTPGVTTNHPWANFSF